MEKNEKRAKLLVETSDSQMLGIIIAVIGVIVTIVLFSLWQRRKSTGRSVLLTGLSGAGKTVLFTRLFHSQLTDTYTSAKENIGDITVNNKMLQIVDIPGHERLRYKFFDKYKNSARGVVYVVDSLNIYKEIRDAAEFLYTLLSDSIMHSNMHLLILCNKQDQTTAKGSGAVQQFLEKEINLLRITKTNQLEATDASSKNFFLGKQGKDFEFSDLSAKIDFAHACESNIEELNSWLHKIQ